MLAEYLLTVRISAFESIFSTMMKLVYSKLYLKWGCWEKSIFLPLTVQLCLMSLSFLGFLTKSTHIKNKSFFTLVYAWLSKFGSTQHRLWCFLWSVMCWTYQLFLKLNQSLSKNSQLTFVVFLFWFLNLPLFLFFSAGMMFFFDFWIQFEFLTIEHIRKDQNYLHWKSEFTTCSASFGLSSNFHQISTYFLLCL